ncbi:unnamed protein product [Brassica napus]|uniref:(rape) hypothetical protein n=1 Tax=Brassica napus TaxID=3708 RepID=A0A816TGV5_BRANA|nr:unnamed protein product [Brassica napus]
MKIYYRSSLIGLVMLTILLDIETQTSGLVVNAQKGRPVRKMENVLSTNGKWTLCYQPM